MIAPNRFPWPGSGPSRDYRYDLIPYQSERPVTAQSWTRIEDGINHLKGYHRQSMNVIPVYHDIDSIPSIATYVYFYDEAWIITLWVDPVAADYTITITESAGAGSCDILIPGGSPSPIMVRGTMDLTVSGTSGVILVPPVGTPVPFLRTISIQSKIRRYV